MKCFLLSNEHFRKNLQKYILTIYIIYPYIILRGLTMNGWDVVITIINQFPPVAMMLLLIAIIVATVIGIVGFSKHGMDFIKHGFQQNALGDLLEKLATKEDINNLRTELKTDINKLELTTKEDINKLRTEVKTDLNKMETRFEKVEARFEKVETKIENMETRFEKVETRFEKLETSMDVRFEKVENKIENMEIRFEKVETELATIKVNHFGHLKNFLTEMTSILLDKHIIENTDKTRLDNQLNGM